MMKRVISVLIMTATLVAWAQGPRVDKVGVMILNSPGKEWLLKM
jgi:hypothetical protein